MILTEKSAIKKVTYPLLSWTDDLINNSPKMILRRKVCSVLKNPFLLFWTALAFSGALCFFYGYQTYVKEPRYAHIGQFPSSQLEKNINVFIPKQNVNQLFASPLENNINVFIPSQNLSRLMTAISEQFKDSLPREQREKKDIQAHHKVTGNSQKGILSVAGKARPKPTEDRGHSKRPGNGNNVSDSIGKQHIHTDTRKTIADTRDTTTLEYKILKLQAQRKQRIADICHLHRLKIGRNVLFGDTYKHMYVIDEQKLLFCYIPKVGCSNWKRILMVLDRKRNNTDDITSREAHAHNGITRLGTISKAEQSYRLQNYRKVMFVRDPLARVVSAYKNKFADLNVYRKAPSIFHTFGKRIVKRYRNNPSRLALTTGENVTFAEFVTYLTNKDERLQFDRHWKEMYKLCSPCQIQYDFIGKLENAYDEAEYVLHNMNFTRSLSFPGRENSHPTNVSTSSDKYFENFSNETLRALWNIYRTDFELFGYKKPQYIK